MLPASVRNVNPARFAVLAFCTAVSISFGALPVCAEPAVNNDAWHEVPHKLRFMVLPTTRYEVNGDEAQVDNGAMVLDSESSGVLNMPLSALQVKPKSLVYVRVRQGCEHVFVLFGAVNITIGHHRVPLSQGEEAVVTDHEPVYRDLVGEDDIGRRRVRMTALPENRHFVLSEFSIIQAAEREPLVYRILTSSDPHDKGIKERLIKTAAVLNIVTIKHGQYSNRLP